jgi:hypothetical protein
MIMRITAFIAILVLTGMSNAIATPAPDNA